MDLFLEKGIVGGVCASPNAAWPVVQIAGEGVRTTVGDYSGGLVRKDIGRIDYFCFQANFAPGMLAITYSNHFPGFCSHIDLLKTRERTPNFGFATAIPTVFLKEFNTQYTTIRRE